MTGISSMMEKMMAARKKTVRQQPAEPGVIRQQIRVSGRVQAVGFRYRAKMAAERLGLTGYVRNEWAGTVFMEVQGSREKIDEMLTALYAAPYIEIEGLERQSIPLEEGERSFRVEY